MSKQLPNVKPLNKRQGGSYTKDPKTGKVTLVNQTKPKAEPEQKKDAK